MAEKRSEWPSEHMNISLLPNRNASDHESRRINIRGRQVKRNGWRFWDCWRLNPLWKELTKILLGFFWGKNKTKQNWRLMILSEIFLLWIDRLPCEENASEIGNCARREPLFRIPRTFLYSFRCDWFSYYLKRCPSFSSLWFLVPWLFRDCLLVIVKLNRCLEIHERIWHASRSFVFWTQIRMIHDFGGCLRLYHIRYW